MALTLQAISSAVLPVMAMGIMQSGMFQAGTFGYEGTAFDADQFEGEPVAKVAEHLRKRVTQVLIAAACKACVQGIGSPHSVS